jgi:broad specificity phosphatase PhoE
LRTVLSFACLEAYSQDKVIVLVRHAEKVDSSADAELSSEGKERALRLVRKIGKYRPKEIFSTDFKRTRDTVQPIATKRHLQIQIYDPRKPQELADKILKERPQANSGFGPLEHSSRACKSARQERIVQESRRF